MGRLLRTCSRSVASAVRWRVAERRKRSVRVVHEHSEHRTRVIWQVQQDRQQVLRDSEGRELLLGKGVDLDGKVLYVEGIPLFKLHQPGCVAPEVWDAVAMITGGRDGSARLPTGADPD